MKNSALIILFILPLMAAHSSPAAEKEWKAASKSLPQLLIDRGVSQLPNLNLQQLTKELDEVTWETGDDKAIVVGSGKARFGCNFYIKDKRVSCNSGATSNVNLPLLSLHEGLSALGYVDEDYQISAAISVHSLLGKGKFIEGVDEHLLNIKKRSKDEIYQKSGGGTSVGGGGDSIGIGIKTLCVTVFTSVLNAKEFTPAQRERAQLAIKRMMAASFENDVSKGQEQIVFARENNQDIVLIPMAQWAWIQSNSNSSNLLENLILIVDPIFDYFLRPI